VAETMWREADGQPRCPHRLPYRPLQMLLVHMMPPNMTRPGILRKIVRREDILPSAPSRP
jgi:hypothetical protein